MFNANALSAIYNESGRHESRTSERFGFIPSTRVIDRLAEHGWNISRASQARVNKAHPDRVGYQKHIVRFRQDGGVDNGVAPEIVLINSHEGTSSFRLLAGLFEVICENGLIVASEVYNATAIRHVGFTDSKVDAALAKLEGEIPQILETRAAWQGIALTPSEIEAFAKAAIDLRGDSSAIVVDTASLTRVRYSRQSDPSLWNVYNRVQDSMIRGGAVARNATTGQRRRTRGITNIAKNVKVNTGLWTLAEAMAKLKGYGA